MRLVWPHAFLLRSCELSDAFASGVASKIVKNFLPTIPGKHVESGKEGPPVALRWSSLPLIGFPRVPFEVFRRVRQRDKTEGLSNGGTFSGTGFIEWQLREMFVVTVSAFPDPGRTLIVEALDRNHEAIPGLRIVFSTTENGRFRSPGIAALRVTGFGKIQSVQGRDQVVHANEPDWERIEIVGFPFVKDELAPQSYDSTLPQGFEPPSLPGLDAAKVRLQIAELLHLAIPPTGVADIPALDWPAPEAGKYLDELRDPKPSSVGLIRECLENTDDLDFAKMQFKYEHHTELEGIRQADLANATPGDDPTQMDVPVVAVTMLSVSTDSFGATALGYGTVDFPPRADALIETFREPPDTARTAFDYMVVATFVFPFIGKVEIAALAMPSALPEAAASLTAATLQSNRPPARDAAATEAVQLRWNLSSQPQGYGFAVSRKSGESHLLNPARGEQVKGFTPFAPERPDPADGAPPGGLKSTFVDPLGPVPITGALSTRYLVIALDVFGRWSPWRLVAHTIAAPAVQAPGLHVATILENGAPTGRVVPSKIEIEFSWNWSDRSADRIEFSGAFFPTAATPPAASPGTFALTAAGAQPNVVLSFSSQGVPSITSGHTGTVLQLDPLEGDDPDHRRYRVTIEARGTNRFRCDFTGVAEVAYAVFARAAERIRATELSAAVGPLVTRFADPIPPIQPVLPVDLRWTALPDAAGRARAVLTWPASANAAGYIVWEGTEAALRHAVDPALPEPAPTTTIFERATALTQLVTAFITPDSVTRAARSMSGFARLNTDLIRTTQVELDLPGRADTIFAYRVSSVSATNLESPRSNSVALFAVPRRNQPGQPRLMLREVNDETRRGIDVIALAGADPRVIGFRVFRVRSTALLNEVGLMGPAKIAHDNAAWRDFDLRAPDGAVQHARAILDPVAESWHPYFYRIVALGFDDPAHGEFRGESLASPVQKAFLTPKAPPLLDKFLTSANPTNRLLSFRTDLPLKATPLGVAKIEIVQFKAVDGKMVRFTIFSIEPENVPVGALLNLLPNPTAAELAAMPEISRKNPDALGRATYAVRVRAEVTSGAVVVIDPLGRITEITF